MAQLTESYKRARSKAHLDLSEISVTASRVTTAVLGSFHIESPAKKKKESCSAAASGCRSAAGGPVHRCVREMTACLVAPATENTLPPCFPRGRKAGAGICPRRCCRPFDPSGFVALWIIGFT